jgi:hypothetical protein
MSARGVFCLRARRKLARLHATSRSAQIADSVLVSLCGTLWGTGSGWNVRCLSTEQVTMTVGSLFAELRLVPPNQRGKRWVMGEEPHGRLAGASLWETVNVRRDPAGPGSRGGNWQLDTIEDVRDYVADFPNVFAGLRVDGDLGVVAFTADLEEHLRGLQTWVEHPELVRVEPAKHAKAKLEADIRAIRRRLQEDPRQPELAGGPGFINLKAPFADLASELHRDYGDALKITLGNKPFPPDRTASRQPVPIPVPTVTIPGLELTISFDEPHVVAGETLRGQVTFANKGSQRVEGMTGVLTGGVRGEGDDFMAGNFTGAVVAVGQIIRLEPGQSRELGLIVGTSSCLPDTS